MAKYLAVDSNTLTYLLESVQVGYDPKTDPSDVRYERVAMLRCFFYGGCSFWVPPTAQAEYHRISNPAKRDAHDRWTKFLLQDMPLSASQEHVDHRTRELLIHHQKENDCSIVAETEAAKLDILLSCDADLASHLNAHTLVRILRPTEYWPLLNIQRGTEPVVRPAPENPLASQTWWQLGLVNGEAKNVSTVRRQCRLFVLGMKWALLLLGLLIPVTLWLLCLYFVVPRIGEWSPFGVRPVSVVGVYGNEEAANKDRREAENEVVYEIKTPDREFYVLTSGEISEAQHVILWNTVNRMAQRRPDILEKYPGSLQGLVSTEERRVLGGRVTTLGRVAQVLVAALTFAVCFALYFPLALLCHLLSGGSRWKLMSRFNNLRLLAM
jgi:hypothetical protein